MQRVRTYLRISPTSRGWKVVASQRKPVEPNRAGYDALPTIYVQLVLELPTDVWEIPTIHAVVPEGAATPIRAEVAS
jgi:hypothetical protein